MAKKQKYTTTAKQMIRWLKKHRPGVPIRGLPAVSVPHDMTRSADSVAVPHEPSSSHARLTASLYPYVTEDDWEKSRAEFLATVRDRIQQDLDTGDY